jgi:4-hydroxymandelate oxidase
VIDLDNIEQRAKQQLSATTYDYYAGGADDELTLSDNVAAWRRIRLVPRVLRDVSGISTSVGILGCKASTPVMVAPWAFQALAHEAGEPEAARGAAAAGACMVVPMMANSSLEAVAEAAEGSPLWFQFYVLQDREHTARLLRRARAAGYRALVMTVDKLPVPGRRRRRAADRFSLPEGTRIPNLSYEVAPAGETGPDEYLGGLLDTTVTFDDVAWACEAGELPVLVKGVLDPNDAEAAVERGASGIVVSNHGGRQLDGAVASADMLAAVVDAVGGEVPVLVDGGIRSGTDVVKALALGAAAVLVARPVIWGLVVDGADGVEAVLRELTEEVAHTMALSGAARVSDLDRSLVAGTTWI